MKTDKPIVLRLNSLFWLARRNENKDPGLRITGKENKARKVTNNSMFFFFLLAVYSPSNSCTENRWIHCGAAGLVDCSQSPIFP